MKNTSRFCSDPSATRAGHFGSVPSDGGADRLRGTSMARAKRRAQTQAKKAAVRHLLKHTDYSYDPNDLSEFEARLVRRYNNIRDCSCWQCGNARRYFGPTLDEQSFEQLRLSELQLEIKKD